MECGRQLIALNKVVDRILLCSFVGKTFAHILRMYAAQCEFNSRCRENGIDCREQFFFEVVLVEIVGGR